MKLNPIHRIFIGRKDPSNVESKKCILGKRVSKIPENVKEGIAIGAVSLCFQALCTVIEARGTKTYREIKRRHNKA